MKSVKTPLFSILRKVCRMALWAEQKQTGSAEAVDLAKEAAWSRRRFLEASGKGLLIAGATPSALLRPQLLRSFNRAVAPRIAIVGGGMAGLSALHTLKKAGIDATVYEASGRSSGRIFTVQNAMGEGTWAEFGAEFIDTNHADMWALAKAFNLELIDFAQPLETALQTETFFFDGRHYSIKDSVDAFRTFAPRLKKDMNRLPDNIDWQTKNKFAQKMDNTSLSAYLDQAGAKGWIKRFIEVSYESEYGLSPELQSAINLLWLISPDTDKGHIELFGESDERYKVRGGNQRIPDAIAQKYPGNIELNRALESIRANSDGSLKMHFSGMPGDVTADFVILALPFTKLREVDVRLDMPAKKRECIDKLSFGTNAKLMLGMQSHFWRKQGFGGLVYSDNGIPNGWDNAQLQTPDNGPAGLSILFGGPSGVKVGEGTPESQKDVYLPKWNQIYPGATAQFSGKVARMHWPSHPFTKCSYVCPTVGQYTSLSGWESVPVGRVYFAGEHCGGEFAGYMNGAALSGREAAEAILKGMD